MNSSPLRVFNPSSSMHVAKLVLNQKIDLVFPKERMPSKITIASSYLRILEELEDGRGNAIYRLCQIFNFEQWGKVSSLYLGRLDITYENGDVSTVSICLEGTNKAKANVLCCINPISDQVRVSPRTIIEVVAFGPMIEKDVDVQILPGESGYKVEQIGHAIVDPENYPRNLHINDMYCVCPRAIGSQPLEHHFFFRCNSSTISKISEIDKGKIDLGMILLGEFLGGENEVYHSLYLQLGVSENKDRIFETLLLPKLDECQGIYLADEDMTLNALKNKYGGMRRRNRRDKRNSSKNSTHNFNHYNGFDLNGYDWNSQDYEEYAIYRGYSSYKTPSPTQKDVEVQVLEPSLTSECKVTTTLKRLEEYNKNAKNR